MPRVSWLFQTPKKRRARRGDDSDAGTPRGTPGTHSSRATPTVMPAKLGVSSADANADIALQSILRRRPDVGELLNCRVGKLSVCLTSDKKQPTCKVRTKVQGREVFIKTFTHRLHGEAFKSAGEALREQVNGHEFTLKQTFALAEKVGREFSARGGLVCSPANAKP